MYNPAKYMIYFVTGLEQKVIYVSSIIYGLSFESCSRARMPNLEPIQPCHYLCLVGAMPELSNRTAGMASSIQYSKLVIIKIFFYISGPHTADFEGSHFLSELCD